MRTDDWNHFFDLFAISAPEAVAVGVSAVAIYLVFLVFVRVFGARVLAQVSTFDALVVIMLGAVAGRVILMDVPWLPAGVIGLGTLFVLEALFGQLRNQTRGNTVLNQKPMVVVADGELQYDAMRRVHVNDEELFSMLRQTGVRRLAEVQFAIFEPHGKLSVLRTGEPIDEALLAGVARVARPRPAAPRPV